MSVFQAVIMGIVQGFAEFLPISSSGHLVLMGEILNISDPTTSDMFLDVLLHLGTFIAVLCAFWKDILMLIVELCSAIADLFTGKKPFQVAGKPHRNFLYMMILSLFPLFLVLPIKNKIEVLFSNPLFVGIALLVTACILFLSGKFLYGKKKMGDIRVKDALTIGFVQLLAVLPGISRSGSTITAGLGVGLRRDVAVRFSFIISLPATLAAASLTLYDAVKTNAIPDNLFPYILGMIAAAISGYIAIGTVKLLVNSNKFKYFGYYCSIVGVLTIGWSIFVK